MTMGLSGMGNRMLLALKCCCLVVLFCLVTGVEAVAHERLSSPAFDPLSGFETNRLRMESTSLPAIYAVVPPKSDDDPTTQAARNNLTWSND